jgi:PTH1 family peptidyl-tRNA hydrolase
MPLRWIRFFLARGFDKDIQAELSEDGSSVSFQEGNQAMWLLVGLGNPGGNYADNRHNVGFMAVDAIADALGLSGKFRKKFQGEIAEGSVFGSKVLILKPQTYMNVSGQSVTAAAQFYKVAPEKIVVFHDEIDIEPNSVRVKKGGGTAGHNGLKSIQTHLGTPEYWRVRIGIGRSPYGGDVSDYVLSDFSKEEQVWLEPLLSERIYG